jgi:hypothetical protein
MLLTLPILVPSATSSGPDNGTGHGGLGFLL